jgi:hypothetical protein
MRLFDTSVIGEIGVLVAAIAVVIATVICASIWQARFTTRVQVLLQCDIRWSSTDMRKTRHKAAVSLLGNKPTVDVDRVLDFFETVAGLLIKRRGLFGLRVIPDVWARHTFYWCAVCYWSKSHDYIAAVQQRSTERDVWKDLCALIPLWVEAEGGDPPTPKDIDDFLNDERNLRL